jgi:hypothetical protein
LPSRGWLGGDMFIIPDGEVLIPGRGEGLLIPAG